jgi:hypothetical protein
MTTRNSNFQLFQYGVEAEKGAGVAATKQLVSIKVTPTAKVETKEHIAQGTLAPAVIQVGKDYTEAKFEGSPIYQEMDFILGSAFATESGTTPGLYEVLLDEPNAADTYIVEIGSSTQCEEFNYAAVSGFSLKVNGRDSVEVSGDILGRKIATGTWSAGATGPTAITPISANDFTLTVGGTTVEAFNTELSVSGRWKMKWVQNAAVPSFKELVEAIPEILVKMDVEADAAGSAYLAQLRGTNATTAVVLNFVHGNISLKFTLQMKIKEFEEYKDIDEIVYGYGIVWKLVYDPSLSSWCKAELDTNAAA